MGKELECLKVVVEADAGKLKQGAGDAKKSVKEMMASISRDIGKIKDAVISISQSMEKIKLPAKDAGADKTLERLDKVKAGARDAAEQLRSMPQPDFTITRGDESVQTLEELKASLKEMQELLSEGYKGAILENLQTELEEVKARFPEATQTIREYEKTLQKAGQATGFTNARKKAKEAGASAERPSNAAKGVGPMISGAIKDSLLEHALNDFKGIKNVAAEARPQVAALGSSLKGLKIPDAFRGKMAEGVRNATYRVKNYVKEAQVAAGLKTYTDDYLRLCADVERAEASLERLNQKKRDMEAGGVSAESKEWQRLAEQIAVAERRLDSYKGKKNLTEYKGQDVQASYGLKDVAKAIPAKLFSGVKALPKEAVGAIRKASGAFAALIQKFKTGLSTIGKVGKSIGGGLAGAFKKLIPGINKAKQANNGLGGSLKGGLKTIMKYAFGIRSLYALVNKLRKAMKEGFQNLAQYSGETNASLSMLMSSLTQFKNSLAAAFAPILNAVAPMLNALIQKIISVMDAFGQLTAALTGKGTYVKAKRVQQDYAASLADAADNADEATKSSEEYQRSIMGFDQINKLDGDSSSDSSNDKADKPGLTPADMFETAPVESRVKGLADKIKEAWKNADFTEIGSILGSKLKSALEGIPWEGIQGAAAKLGKSLATLINGFVEVPGLGRAIGDTIAQAINTGLIGLNAFAKNLHWHSVGKFIADGINGVLEGIDWKTALSAASHIGSGLADLLNNILTPQTMSNVGRTLSMGINTIFTGVRDFTARFDWSGVGSAVGAGINAALSTLDWTAIRASAVNIGTGVASFLNQAISTTDFKQAGESLGQAVNTVIDLGCSFVTAFDWSGFGSKTADGINGALQTVDFAKAGTTISELIKGLLDWFIKAVENTNWRLFGEKVKEFLVSIDWNGIFDKLSEAIGAAFGGLAAFLGGLLSDGIAEAKNFFDKRIEECGGSVVKGILKGIVDALAAIGQWIYNHIVSPFIEGFKKGFGIHSPSTVMAKQGGFIIDGLLNGLKNAIGSVLSWVAKMPGWIKDKLGDAKNWLVGKGKDAIAGLKNGWDSVKESKIGQAASQMGSFVKRKAGDAKAWIKSKGSDAISGLKTGWEAVKSGTFLSKVAKIGGEVHTKIGDVKSKTKGKGQDVIKGMVSGYNAQIDKLLDKAKALKDSVYASIGNVSSKVKPKGVEIATGLKDGLESKNGWPSVSKWLSGIPGKVKSAVGSLYDAGRSVMSSFADGMKSVSVPTPHMYLSDWDRHYMGDGGVISTPKFSVQWYASGGFPQAGEMFIAKENGPEMVGRMGNRNAVANNSQIVEGITAGVFEAVMDAFEASGALERGDGGGGAEIEFILNVDSETLYRAVRKGAESRDGRLHAVCHV